MNYEQEKPIIRTRGIHVGLMFALVAERLKNHYEHGQWLTEAQGISLARDWLARSKQALPLAERRTLSDLSDQLARRLAESVSRDAGLFISHELNEALDPNYQSEFALTIVDECEQMIVASMKGRFTEFAARD